MINLTSPNDTFDVLIVGGGLAGTMLALQLWKRSLKVGLIDQREIYPPCFKAERYNAESARLCKKLGAWETFSAIAYPISQVNNAYGGAIYERVQLEMYGLYYHDFVNHLRREVPSRSPIIVGRVKSIVSAMHSSAVILDDGRELRARLIVMANGAPDTLVRPLGVTKRALRETKSLVIGFDVAALEGSNFNFDATNFYSARADSAVAIMSFFRTQRSMRVNLTTYWSPRDSRLNRLKENPATMLNSIFRGLNDIVGSFRLASPIQTGQVEIYKAENCPSYGVVLAGDALRTVCPATGAGVTKALNDADILSEYIPIWLSKGRIGAEDFRQFYRHPQKLLCDSNALQASDYLHKLGTAKSLVWRIERNPYLRNLKHQVKQFAVGQN